ncbi:MAG: 50S ribosomal protein L2 [Candidatus Bathyarchaeota archaeon]|nr:50S ribosomal protein L2 [Candidatus Bathyarchaeota archaeon]
MGKRIRVQRRGRGSSTFRASTHKRVAPAKYPTVIGPEEDSLLKGTVKELVHEPGRGSPLAKIELQSGEGFYAPASEGVYVGQEIHVGSKAPVEVGNILPLGQIPSGIMVCNIELRAGDGGRIAKASGTYATVVSHSPKGTVVKLPSGRSVVLKDSCRAMIGVISGAGRVDKPFLKAGKKVHWMRAKGRKYPITKGVSMIAAVHPHGGGSHGSSSLKPTSVSRRAPPGQKVGLIAPKRTGRKKRKRKS